MPVLSFFKQLTESNTSPLWSENTIASNGVIASGHLWTPASSYDDDIFVPLPGEDYRLESRKRVIMKKIYFILFLMVVSCIPISPINRMPCIYLFNLSKGDLILEKDGWKSIKSGQGIALDSQSRLIRIKKYDGSIKKIRFSVDLKARKNVTIRDFGPCFDICYADDSLYVAISEEDSPSKGKSVSIGEKISL